MNEPNETFTVAISNPFNATLGTPTSQTVTITNDDLQPTLTWQNSAVSGSETGGSVGLTVQLSAAASTNVTVNYATANGTATAGSDYTTASGTLTFLPGETNKTVNITILNDVPPPAESNETFTVGLSSSTNASIGTPTSAAVTSWTTPRPARRNVEPARNRRSSMSSSSTTMVRGALLNRPTRAGLLAM